MRWRVAGLLFALLQQPAVAGQRFAELGAGRGLNASVVNAMLILLGGQGMPLTINLP